MQLVTNGNVKVLSVKAGVSTKTGVEKPYGSVMVFENGNVATYFCTPEFATALSKNIGAYPVDRLYTIYFKIGQSVRDGKSVNFVSIENIELAK